jgi:uncharacterized repeat protein (TIGR03847 family)
MAIQVEIPAMGESVTQATLLRWHKEEGEQVRIWATREQMLALARRGADVVAAGRPQCRYCGNPMDPEGHQCPAMNGQGEL